MPVGEDRGDQFGALLDNAPQHEKRRRLVETPEQVEHLPQRCVEPGLQPVPMFATQSPVKGAGMEVLFDGNSQDIGGSRIHAMPSFWNFARYLPGGR